MTQQRQQQLAGISESIVNSSKVTNYAHITYDASDRKFFVDLFDDLKDKFGITKILMSNDSPEGGFYYDKLSSKEKDELKSFVNTRLKRLSNYRFFLEWEAP